MDINDFYKRYWELIQFRNEFKFHKKVLKAWDNMEFIELSDTFKIIKSKLKDSSPKILDVGAGDRKLLKIIEKICDNFTYKSLDIASNIVHDYNDITKV